MTLKIYSLFLNLYNIGIRISSIWNPKAKLWIKGRQKKIDFTNLKNCIWFHAASLGEFEQVSYLIEQVRASYSNEKILVSFFSPSGYEIKKNFKFADQVIYLPFDFRKDMEEFVDQIQPKMVFWVRYEFWLNTLTILKEKSIPVYLLNGVFTEQINPIYLPILKKCLTCFSQIFVINEPSKLALNTLGFDSEILADSRYDRMNQVRQTPFEDQVIQHFANHNQVVICGSTWPSDDKIMKSAIHDRNDIQWIIFPHEVNQLRIEDLKHLFPSAQLYSTYSQDISSNILIIDKIGLLSRAYRYADLCYVGGGFEKVVHSLIEPLAYGIPILIGKNIAKSEEAKEFVEKNLVTQVLSSEGFIFHLNKNLKSSDHLDEKVAFFNLRIGANNKIMELVKKNLDLCPN